MKEKITYSEAYLTAIDMAVDALEVAHVKGAWLKHITNAWDCSECGRRIYSASCPGENYCAACGADMRASRALWRKQEDEKREKDIAEGKLRSWP